MHLEAPDRFATALGRTEIERGVLRWVVCPGLRQCLDSVVDLSWDEKRKPGRRRRRQVTSCRRSCARV